MKLVIIGIPGAGKSTQGNLLSHQLAIPYLSTGHIFRTLAQEKNQLGRHVKEIMHTGYLIPDTQTLRIVEQYLSRKEYKKGYILDGFPRTIMQARQFKNGIDKVIYLNLPDKEVLWRLAFRNEERGDDTIEAIKRRIKVFHTFTDNVIKYYKKKGLLIEIDGTKTIEEVNKEILNNLGKQIVKNKVREWKVKKKKILAITALAGSGKTEAACYFHSKGLPVIHFGKVINDYVDRYKLDHTEKVHSKVRMELREKYGMDSIAKLNKDKIDLALKNNAIVVVDGLSSWQEYEFIKSMFKNVEFLVLAIWASKEIRYKRIKKRSYRNLLKGRERDIDEVIEANRGPTIALADFLVVNESGIKDLHYKLEDIYRSIYFS